MKTLINITYKITSAEKSVNADYLLNVLPESINIPTDENSITGPVEIEVYLKNVSSQYIPYGQWKTSVDIEINGENLTFTHTHNSEEYHTCFSDFYNQNWFREEEEQEITSNCQSIFETVIDNADLYYNILDVVDEIVNVD